MSTELQPAKATKPMIAASDRGVKLTNIEEMYRFAEAVVQSGFAPKGMERPQSVMVALELGAELGLTPMSSIQSIAVINNRPTLWGDGMLAVCRASGVFDEEIFEETITKAGNTMTATCTVRRLPNGRAVVRTFDMEDAKCAGLAGKAGPWSQYPKRMLQMRARSWALRDCFTDYLRGIQTGEEVQDYQSLQPRILQGDTVQGLLGTSGQTDQPTAAPEHVDPPSPGQDHVDPPAPEPVTQDDPMDEEVLLGQYREQIAAAASTLEVDAVVGHATENAALSQAAKETITAWAGDRKGVIRAGRGEKTNRGRQRTMLDTQQSATERGQ